MAESLSPTRRGLLSTAAAMLSAAALQPTALFAQDNPVSDEGALGANAAFARAVRAASALLADQFGPTRLSSLSAEIINARSLAANVPDSERAFLRQTFPAEAAGMVELGRVFLSQIGIPTDLAALARTGGAIAELRGQLSAREEGRGLASSVLGMLAFGVEFGVARRIGTEKSRIRGLLDDYRLWADSMRTQQAGAIPFRQTAAARSHDDGLLALAETHYGSRLGLVNFAIGRSQSELRVADPCLIVARNVLSFSFDRRSGTRLPSNPRAIFSELTPNVFVGFSKIEVRDDERFGARIIKFDPGSGGNYSLSNHFLFHPGVDSEYCYVIRSNTELSIAQIRARAEENPSYREDRETRASVVAAIKNANACRIEIALSGRALAMLSQFDGLIENYGRSL